MRGRGVGGIARRTSIRRVVDSVGSREENGIYT